MFETIFTLLIIPLATKVGEKARERIIDSLATGVDKKLKDLMERALSNSNEETKLLAYLKQNPEFAKQVHANSEAMLRSGEVAGALDLPRIASRGSKIRYYQAILRGMGEMASRRGKDLVLAGFLNSPMVVTLIEAKQMRAEPLLHNDVLLLDMVFHIEIAFQDSEATRDSRVAELRLAARRGNGRVRPELRGNSYYVVSRIYDNWIALTQWKSNDLDGVDSSVKSSVEKGDISDLTVLPMELQNRLAIDNYDGLTVMVKSASDLILEEAADLAKLGAIVLA